MPLARLVNYVNGNVLTGPQLNAEFDNILNNGPALVDIAPARTSQVQGLIGSIAGNVGSFAALGYTLRSTSGFCSVSATSSFSVNTQTPGPIVNGRDQVGAFASTTVHFYAISTGGASTASAGIVSSNPPPTGPTLPANYTAWAYLGSAIYSATTSGAVESFYVNGSRIARQAAINTTQVSGMTSTEVVCNLGAIVPTIATRINLGVVLSFLSTPTLGGNQVSHTYSVDSSPVLGAMRTFSFSAGVASTRTWAWSGDIDLPQMNTTPVVYFTASPSVATTEVVTTLRVASYTVPNGDA